MIMLRPSHQTAFSPLYELFIDQNICCVYSTEPPQWRDSFVHPKQMLKLMNDFFLNFTLKLSIWTYLQHWYFIGEIKIEKKDNNKKQQQQKVRSMNTHINLAIRPSDQRLSYPHDFFFLVNTYTLIILLG